jgi:hypothetical protein
MISDNRKAYSGSTGRVAEVRFMRAAAHMGLEVVKSSRSDDMNKHVDYWLAYDSMGPWGVDVKGNNLPDEIWVELMNVQGKSGWLYGESKIIAFDMPEEGGFSVVDTEELRIFCEENVEDTMVSNKADAELKKYRRKDRLDIITKLNLMIIRSLKTYRVWRYFKDY